MCVLALIDVNVMALYCQSLVEWFPVDPPAPVLDSLSDNKVPQKRRLKSAVVAARYFILLLAF